MSRSFLETFHGNLRLEDKVRSVILRSGLVFVDANVLLDLYRVKSSTRKQAKAVLSSIQPRLRLTYYVAVEYFKNRQKVIDEKNQEISSASSRHKKTLENLKKEISDAVSGNQAILASSGTLEGDIDHLITKIEEVFASSVEQKIDQKNDEVLSDLLSIFAQGVEGPPSQDSILETEEDGAKRYQRRIPPGFSDDEKKENVQFSGLEFQSKYGDFHFWKDVMRISREENSPAVVVTSDRKSDWWQLDSSKRIISVHPHLRYEFRECVGKDFVLMSFKDFLGNAEAFGAPRVNEESVSDVENVARTQYSVRFVPHFPLAEHDNLRIDLPVRERVEQDIIRWVSDRYGDTFASYGEGKKRGIDFYHTDRLGQVVAASVRILPVGEDVLSDDSRFEDFTRGALKNDVRHFAKQVREREMKSSLYLVFLSEDVTTGNWIYLLANSIGERIWRYFNASNAATKNIMDVRVFASDGDILIHIEDFKV